MIQILDNKQEQSFNFILRLLTNKKNQYEQSKFRIINLTTRDCKRVEAPFHNQIQHIGGLKDEWL